jgi:hypothetical protein
MDNLSLYGLAFLISTVKFLFAASIVGASALTPLEIALATGLGALCSFNIIYWTSSYFMNKAKDRKERKALAGIPPNKRIEAVKKKPVFTKMNKYIIRAKLSKSGFWLICILAPLFLSIPIGSILVAKFYRNTKLAYPLANISIIAFAFILAYFNKAIFSLF